MHNAANITAPLSRRPPVRRPFLLVHVVQREVVVEKMSTIRILPVVLEERHQGCPGVCNPCLKLCNTHIFAEGNRLLVWLVHGKTFDRWMFAVGWTFQQLVRRLDWTNIPTVQVLCNFISTDVCRRPVCVATVLSP